MTLRPLSFFSPARTIGHIERLTHFENGAGRTGKEKSIEQRPLSVTLDSDKEGEEDRLSVRTLLAECQR